MHVARGSGGLALALQAASGSAEKARRRRRSRSKAKAAEEKQREAGTEQLESLVLSKPAVGSSKSSEYLLLLLGS